MSDANRATARAYGAAAAVADQYPRRLSFVIGPDGRIERAIATADPAAQAAELLPLL